MAFTSKLAPKIRTVKNLLSSSFPETELHTKCSFVSSDTDGTLEFKFYIPYVGDHTITFGVRYFATIPTAVLVRKIVADIDRQILDKSVIS